MALIKCPECGAMVSDKATSCPHCGCPIGHEDNADRNGNGAKEGDVQQGAPQYEADVEPPKKKDKGKIVALVIVLLCLLGGGGYFAYTLPLKNTEILSADSATNVQPIRDGTYSMKGSIGKYSVYMQLIVDKGQVHGTYYYSTWSPDKVLFLEGNINEGKVVLEESTEAGRSSAKWKGRFDGNDYSGTFENTVNGKTLSFSLTVTDEPYKGRTARKEPVNEEATEETTDASDSHDWLQGTWSARVVMYGSTKTAKLVINGNHAAFYSDSEALDNGEWQVYDGELHFGSTYFKIDDDRELVKFDDTHFFDHTSQPRGAATSITSPSQDKEMRIMSRLHELGNKGQTLVSELSSMRQSGHINPTRYMYIKQTLLGYKDEQIQLARQLGDRKMEREYEQQKETVTRAFDMLENGRNGW